MNDPIFQNLAATHKFTSLPTDYTPRMTPDQVREQAISEGLARGLNLVLQMIDEYEKPTAQMKNLRGRVEDAMGYLHD
jgi:hypothetical protein